VRRYHLSKKKIKEIKNKLAMEIWEDGSYEIVEGEFVIILKDGEPVYFYHEGKYYPTLPLLWKTTPERSFVTVDMGAVKHILNGANIFAAGIVDADPLIKKGDCVYVRDEKYKKAIAIGLAMMNGKEMKLSKEGLAVKNLHYYGDKIFKMF